MDKTDEDIIIVEERICEKSTSGIHSLPAVEDVARILECPVCMDVPFGPIVLCSSGHSICRNCSEEVRACPTCQKDFIKTRCLGLESMISLLKFDCNYIGEGCKVGVPAGGRFKMHLESCGFRNILCNERCGIPCVENSIPFSKFITHLITKHGMQGSPTKKNEMVLKQSVLPPLHGSIEWSYTSFQYDGQTFLEKSRISGAMIYWWVSVAADSATAFNYSATLVVSQDLTQTTIPIRDIVKKDPISWEIPVVTFRDAINERSPEIAVLPLKSLLELTNSRSKPCKKCITPFKHSWDLRVTIQKRIREFHATNQ